MPPNKLKNGYGDGVCIVLISLTQASLNNKFRFKKPVIKEDGNGGFGEEDDDLGDEFEGNADIADMHHGVGGHGSDSEDIDCDLDFKGAGNAKNNDQEML
jgi:hypothetical protein